MIKMSDETTNTDFNQQKQNVEGDQTNVAGDNKTNIEVKHIQSSQVEIVTGNKYGIPLEEFRALSKELDITESALKSFFKILEQKQVPSEDLDSTLREIAKRYKDLLKTVEHLQPEDPRVAELIEQAQEALKQCDVDKCQFAKAEMLFNEAGDLDIEAAKKLQESANISQ